MDVESKGVPLTNGDCTDEELLAVGNGNAFVAMANCSVKEKLETVTSDNEDKQLETQTPNADCKSSVSESQAITESMQIEVEQSNQIETAMVHTNHGNSVTNSIHNLNECDDSDNGLVQNDGQIPTSILNIEKPSEDTCKIDESNSVENNVLLHVHCLATQEQQRLQYQQQLEHLRAALSQKENMISLIQRENELLEKEKQAYRRERDLANSAKESTVIKFAMKEKLLIDAKKEKEAVEKQLAEAKKEIKNVSIRFQAVNEEKSRMSYIIDEKCNELRKYQRECEKLKTDCSHMESKLKYHVNKLNLEIEAKAALEKKLQEERNSPNRMEERANEKLKVEYEASTILLKHEIQSKSDTLDKVNKEYAKAIETIKQLQEQLNHEINEKVATCNELKQLREEHNSVQNAYSDEMLNSAKLRGQLEELNVLKTQNTLNEEKIGELQTKIVELEELLADNAIDLKELHTREVELLAINKEMSESIVLLQNEICLLKAKAQGHETENSILKQEKTDNAIKYARLEQELKMEKEQRTEELRLLTKRLSEKTKLYETVKLKLENALGDAEAMEHKHATLVKELQRELQKFKKAATNTESGRHLCSQCQHSFEENSPSHSSNANGHANESHSHPQTHSRNSSESGRSSSRPSELSDMEIIVNAATAVQDDLKTAPSKKHLVERILRLQQASARQTEKIDFLENHTLSLVSELQKKSKVIQYYMLRDQAGALTSSKSDQNKSELAKYGNGVMSAIYGGIRGDNKGMNLELSLEINKKLQAVLEDTLLKNITLKENLDVLGLEVDNLTKKLRQSAARE